jgi:predicted regulator of Ras-like GTPase activity (Roadblock/LC7/MglB family)
MDCESTVQEILQELSRDSAIIGALVTNQEAEPLGFIIRGKGYRQEILNAASAALVSLSKLSFSQMTNEDTNYILGYTDKTLYITIVTESELILTSLIDRYQMGSTKLEYYFDLLKGTAQQVVGVIGASKYAKKSLIGLVRKEIPEATAIAVVSREGVPISVDSKFDSALISGLISAFYTSGTSFAKDLQVSVIVGRSQHSLIMYNVDDTRILAVLIPKGQGSHTYIPKIRRIIEDSKSA